MNEVQNLRDYCLETARDAKEASKKLVTFSTEQKNGWLKHSAALIRDSYSAIEKANSLDLENTIYFGLTNAQIDRLKLDENRVESIASGLEQVADLPDPIGEILEEIDPPNGLSIRKIRVPLGVVFFIYESRPNVTADAAAICVKSGNAVILRGGKEAIHSSKAIVDLLIQAGEKFDLPNHAVQLVSQQDRAAVGHFLELDSHIDLTIPRGGPGLIQRVAANAMMPVMKHDAGNCHIFVDETADLDMAEKIILNAKCQRPGVCNACESLLVHQSIAEKFVPLIAKQLSKSDVEIVGDAPCQSYSDLVKPAHKDDYGAEFLSLKISMKVVADIQAAIDHINEFGSGHTDAIISNCATSQQEFSANVDTAAVMINASTRFNDGGEFGMGAEIGISTDKFHARGPCGLKELTTYKYICNGNGTIRS